MDINKLKICATCLSTDRSLILVKDVKNFMKFSKIKRPDLTVVHICWECDAIVKKILAFREKAIRAQAVISHILENNLFQTSIKHLSSLTRSSVKICQVSCEVTTRGKTPNDETLEEQPVDVSDADDLTKYCIQYMACDTENNDGDEIERNEDEAVKQNDGKEVPHKSHGGHSLKAINSSQNIYSVKVIGEGELMKAREDRRDSIKFQKSLYKCLTCVEYFRDKKIWQDHQMKHLKENKFECTICAQRFPVKAALSYHKELHYRSYTCRTCLDVFPDEYSVDRHYQDEHDETRYQCGDCDATLPNKRLYIKHRRAVHKKMVACPHCENMYTNSSNLKRHITTHMERKLLKCDACPKQFRTHFGLKNHKASHLNQRDENAYCVECDIQFKDVFIYRNHLRSTLKHISKEHSRFPCPKCDSIFLTMSYLKAHIQYSHNEEKKYVCQQCDMVFKAKLLLRRHISTKHENKPRKLYTCDVCNKKFTSLNAFRDHKNTHTGARPYICNSCGATFGFKAALYNHNKLVHLRNKSKGKVANTREIKNHRDAPSEVENHGETLNDLKKHGESPKYMEKHGEIRICMEKHEETPNDTRKHEETKEVKKQIISRCEIKLEEKVEEDWIEDFFNV